MEAMQGLQVISIEAENFKKLKVFNLTPTEDITVISGMNEQGKTTAVDLVWFALDAAGYMKATKTSEPLRQGEKRGFVKLAMGHGQEVELTATRKINAEGKVTLDLKTAEGYDFNGGTPQAILDALTGAISFDPMSFASKKPEDQKKTLVELVTLDIDLDKWAADRQAIFDQRTEINRKKRDKEGEFLAFSLPESGTPDEELKSDVILKKITAAQEVIRKNDAKRQELTDARTESRRLTGLVQAKDSEITAHRERLEELKLQLADMEENISFATKEKGKLEEQIKAGTVNGLALAAEVDALEDPELDAFNEELRTLEETNRKIRAKADRVKAKEAFENLEKDSQKLTDRLQDMDDDKVSAIKKAKFPIDGLCFDDDGILYKGVPFSQASSAERLRVSLAIAIALNPRLRWLRIADGSLLDKKNMAIIKEMCGSAGYRAFVEKVADEPGCGLYIEDGEVKAVN